MNGFFKIQTHEVKTLAWWNGRKSSIDFSPSYQRGAGLWSDQDKAYLIDSILNGFDIPKLYMADYQYGYSALNKKKLPYAIIDGKQRLGAIFDFFESKFPLEKSFVLRRDPNLNLGGLTFKDLQKLHPNVAEEFENSSLTIMSVYTDDETLINELFVRLNRSKPLTGAEVRNAMPGKVPDVIRQIANHLLFQENIRFNTRRAGDSNAAAKILLFEYENAPVSTKKKDLDHFSLGDWVDTIKLELAARRTIDTLYEMRDIFAPNDKLLSSSGVFPVYYWFVRGVSPSLHRHIRPFLLIFEHGLSLFKNIASQEDLFNDADEDLRIYNKLNRSTNDAGSHFGRYRILMKLFNEYLFNRGIVDNPERDSISQQA